ncbi:SH3 domain-containing RING finger protein 3 [Biomphalaria glabrata]|uniref:E3 ubiquitin-protein ligase SH3RF3-like n=1 Tax=Biomphalaria glabrata TaxID=6526 RepID=A0A9W3B5B7_BIOGL|nr:E3 ubiquitin-protein ligase SH3RF3-like [Biomphalaria glabrata]XP_055894671.1 E3 ubiquitin-protein ligase SH3RF3-like [Biomphalaria glabrata]KAI8734093.1 SH3 domain-containing RING finger protein 3-like [Biomphalaria glabrata]
MDEKQINELLECSVCLERFDQNCKVLPCQHTFCRQCLDEIVLTQKELRCPECRALVTVRVAELPTNILVVRILEGLKTKGHRYPGSRHGHVGLSPSKTVTTRHDRRHETAAHLSKLGTPCAEALYRYDSLEKDDLPFDKGDIIILRRQIDENWYQGELSGRLGYFPANFVQILVPLPHQIPQCRALYDFHLKDEAEKDCLSFKKDEVLTVIRRVDENWLEGRKGDRIGIFPITFVELNDAARLIVQTKSNPAPSLPQSSSSSVNANRSVPASVSAGTAPLPGSPVAAAEELSCSSPFTPISSETVTTVSSQPVTAGSLSPVPLSSGATPPLESVQLNNNRHSHSSSPLLNSSPVTTSSDSHNRHSTEVVFPDGHSSTSLVPDSATSASSSPLSPLTSGDPQGSSSTSRNTSSTNTASEVCPDSTSSSQSGSLTTPVYIALYNYKPQKEDELDLHKGEYYSVSEKCQDGWFKGACLRTGEAGVFPGNYVSMVRHSSAFKPVSPNVLNIRAKAPLNSMVSPASTAHSEPRSTAPSTNMSNESPSTTSMAPPLLPRVAKMQTSGQKPRSPSSQLAPHPSRSLSSPTAPSSPKHVFSPPRPASPTSSSSSSLFGSLSRPLIPAPPQSSLQSTPHHALWLSPGWQSMSASANITPPNVVMVANSLEPTSSAPAKKDKKDKEKKGLVKLLSGKSKKSKQTPAVTESAPPLAVVCFDGVNHMRSGSYPVETVATSSSGRSDAHRKAASFDSTTAPPVPVKPRPKPVPRERYYCKHQYPPQTEHELALEVGDIIHVHRKRDDGWYKGTQERTGKTGLFPASFVEKCD